MKRDISTQKPLVVLFCLCLLVSAIPIGLGIAAAQQGEEEPNDSQNSATSINTGERVNARLGLGDEDWYSFQVDSQSTLHIELEDLGGANVELIGPSGATLETEGPLPSDFSIDVDKSGTYYLRFIAVGSANGDYSFTVNVAGTSDSDSNNDGASDSNPENMEDKWGERCSAATPVDGPGTYRGVLDVPGDVDAMEIELNRGDVITYSSRVADGHSRFYVNVRGKMDVQDSKSESPNVEIPQWGGIIIESESNGGPNNWIEFVVTNDDSVCFSISELEENNANFPYEWELTIEKGRYETSELGDTTPQENSAKNAQRITELQETIDEQQERIQELESQLEAANGVTINVTVKPAGDQNSFVSGSRALVDVSAKNADLSQFRIKYGTGTYDVGQDGEVEVPLVDAGQHEMVFSYGETSKAISINVQSDGDTAQDNTQTSAPGFSTGAVLIAFVCLILFSRIRN